MMKMMSNSKIHIKIKVVGIGMKRGQLLTNTMYLNLLGRYRTIGVSGQFREVRCTRLSTRAFMKLNENNNFQVINLICTSYYIIIFKVKGRNVLEH